MTTTAILVAAGRGTRAGGDTPKQWQMLAGQRVADYAVAAFVAHPQVDHVVMVLHPDDLTAGLAPAGVLAAPGGASRAQSVLAGLAATPEGTTQVLIHDAARPLVGADVIDRVLGALNTHPGAAPALPVVDALWRGDQGQVAGTQDRTGLYRAQTPQGFRLPDILAAHRAHPGDAADDVEVARAFGLDVAIVAGDESNMKVTLPGDFARAEQMMRSGMKIRMGNGYDVHKFGPGDHVVLCGVTIPFDQGLVGHSDADVGMHALTDAIYGALARGDIGQHFPPSDPQWKGAKSDIFLRHAVDLAASMGYDICNVDVTLICEQPKIGPQAQAMRAALAGIIGIQIDQVSVKATTSELLGFTGRGEGIAAQASAVLETP